MDLLRTPDDRFEGLPDFGYEPHYVEVDSGEGERLRVAYLDEGPRNAETVLLLHEPARAVSALWVAAKGQHPP